MRYFSTFSGIGGFELGIQQAYDKKIWNAQNASKSVSSIKEEGCANLVLESTNSNGGLPISKIAEQQDESTTLFVDSGFSIRTEEAVLAAERMKKNFLHSNTETEMVTKIGESTGQAICTSLLSRKMTKTNTKSSVTTAIMQGEDTVSVPMCVGFSEIDKYAKQIYAQHFPKHQDFGDITKINADELPDFDLLVGGFPCQAFSIAGKRRGFEDTRGTMFFELARILRAKQPRLFLFENVKGLLSHDDGNTFKTIISAIDELGYDCQWQVLNSKNHGVPQNRERVLIVGHLRGTPRPKVFPFGADCQEAPERGVHTGTLTSRYPASQREGTYIEENGHGSGEIEQINSPRHSNDRIYGAGGISPTLNTMQGGNRQPFVTEDKLSVRKLTPKECERLQGFPDGWTASVSDTQRYKTLGNAVTVNVIQDVMERILSGLIKEE